MPGYDNVAWFYDRLSRLVFGRAQVNAQLYLLDFIPANARILIVGGGTGWILEEISRLHNSGLHIIFVDASPKMVAKAREKETGANTVAFITAGAEQVNFDIAFDIVLTPFLFDNLSDNTAEKTCNHLGKYLTAGGLWLYCDFKNTKRLWQKVLLASMYFFFKACCGIEASHLPDMESHFRKPGLRLLRQQSFMDGFIVSAVYKKVEN